MGKRYIVIICAMSAIVSLFPGCFETGGSIFTIVYQNIGDEIIYDLTISTTTSTNSFSRTPTQTYSMSGTLTSKVLGMESITDGFGYEKEALIVSTRYFITGGISGLANTYNFTVDTYQYFDINSKTPIKFSTVTSTASGSQLLNQNFSTKYNFFFTKKMNELISSVFSLGATSGVLMFSPGDIISSFEGKSIKKGDTGTITIGSLKIPWTAVGTEKINEYECIIVSFSTIISADTSKTHKLDIKIEYRVWLTASFPTLIKIKSTVDTKSETTMETFGESSTYSSESQTVTELILKSSSQGDIPINWGSSSPSYPNNNVFGEYKQWKIYPELGDMETIILFTPSEAISFAENNSADFRSYMKEHPNAYALFVQYEKNEAESWTFSFRDNTFEGYEIKISKNESETSILSDENKTYTKPGLSREALNQTMLTFSGIENILKHYATYDSSQQIQIMFVANTQDIYSSSLNTSTNLFTFLDFYPTSLYSMVIGNIFEGSHTWVIGDAETGQIIMLFSIEMS